MLMHTSSSGVEPARLNLDGLLERIWQDLWREDLELW